MLKELTCNAAIDDYRLGQRLANQHFNVYFVGCKNFEQDLSDTLSVVEKGKRNMKLVLNAIK